MLLVGCTMNSNTTNREPQLEIPTQWASSGIENTYGEPIGWLGDFTDPRLEEMVKEALEGNFDLRITASRLENSRAAAMLAGADQLPTLSVRIDGSHGETKTVVEDFFVNTENRNYGIGLSTAWEIDLWGRLNNLAASADADLKTAEADYEAARLSLAAKVAKTWFNVTTASLQLRLAEQAVDSCKNVVKKIRADLTQVLPAGWICDYLLRQPQRMRASSDKGKWN